MSRILVTGGLGYIGSHTVVELVLAGMDVVIIDDLSNSNIEVKSRLEGILGKSLSLEILDINNSEALLASLSQERIDGVIHFAAFKAVGESVNEPIKYYKNNISGLINLLDVMDKKDIKHLIFSSSCTVYGETSTLPVTEVVNLVVTVYLWPTIPPDNHISTPVLLLTIEKLSTVKAASEDVTLTTLAIVSPSCR